MILFVKICHMIYYTSDSKVKTINLFLLNTINFIYVTDMILTMAFKGVYV